MSTLLELFQPFEIPRFFLTELDISNRPEVLQNWALLSTWGPESLQIIASGAVAERAALEIAGWDRGSRDSILRVLLVLRCSASIQVEIVERINEIAIREGKVGVDIIDTPRVREILETTGLNHRQKTQALRELLSELRYPRLSSRQRRFKRQSEAVGLPTGTRIIPPAAFEGNNWRMELSFTDVQELLKMLDLTMSIVQSGRLDAILGVKGEG